MSARTDRYAERSLWALLSVALTFVSANVLRWWGTLGHHQLVVRRFDYEWELQLAWRAARGEWVGVDFAYPIGPLWQLLSWIAAAGHTSEPEMIVAGMHAVFPLASLVVALILCRAVFPPGWKRTVAFAVLALLALHDDVRTLRAIVSLALMIAYVPTAKPGEPLGTPRWRRALVAAGTLTCAAALSLDGAILGVAAILVMAITEAALGGGARVAAGRAARTLGPAAIVVGLFVGLAALAGGQPWAIFGESGAIVRAYSVNMAFDAREITPGPLITFAVLGFAPIAVFASHRFRDVNGAMWLAGAVPLVLRASLRSDAEHAYAALMPVVALLTFIALRHTKTQPWTSVWGGLLAALFLLGWFAEGHAPGGGLAAGRLREREPDPAGGPTPGALGHGSGPGVGLGTGDRPA